MNEIMNANIKMTSLDISEIVGKEHKNVMRDIRNEITSLGTEIGKLIFEPTTYKDSQNKERPCYTFGKDGAMQLALRYDAKTRFKVIKRIEELESSRSFKLPGNYKEALIQLVGQVEENEKLQTQNLVLVQENKDLKPKADYTDIILKNKGLVTITQIAKDYGMSAQEMNEILHDLKVQFKQSGQWLLYRKYDHHGYTHSETIHFTRKDGTPDVKMNTKWTQKGRLFIYNLLKKNDILPLIEKELVEI